MMKSVLIKLGIPFLILAIILFGGSLIRKQIAQKENIVSNTGEVSESVSWTLPQSEKSIFSEEEKEQLQKEALTAAEQVKDVYRDIKISEGSIYTSNIENFADNHGKMVISLLGQAGYTSVAKNCNMENPEQIEKFYSEYLKNRDGTVTVFEVNRDGLISVITFKYFNGKMQTFYIAIGWQEGGVPEVRYTLVRDVTEIKLTEKGYFIYAYKQVIEHADLRQYFRTKPISDECRELTEKYISGLSFVNYNAFVTDWNIENVEDILMPSMFEDIYRIYTGENLEVENDRIPAEIYEKVMTACFPVTQEQLRKNCGYDRNSDSYQYIRIYASPHPPFGEVIDYTENEDGTITLIVDGVWTDYNSDCAFTNHMVIQPSENGSFKFLSNSTERKELELPPIASVKWK